MKKIVLLFLLFVGLNSEAQMTSVVPNSNASALAQMMAGPGVTTSNASFYGHCDSTVQAARFYATPNTVFGLDSGIVLSTGTAASGAATGVNIALGSSPGTCGAAIFASTSVSAAGTDADLSTLGGGVTINDACVLEFDFVPLGDTVKFDYVFGSEEYETFNCSINDIFGFFISGPGIVGTYSGALNASNIALIPGTSIPVAISTINSGANAAVGNPCYTNTNNLGPFTNLYVSNIDSFNIGVQTGMSYTGFSKTLTALAIVVPCSTYHLKLAVGDASDHIYDTGVFLKAGSLSSNAIVLTPISALTLPFPYIVEGCSPGFVKVSRPVAMNVPLTINYTLSGAANYPADYSVSTIPSAPMYSVIIPANQTDAYIVFNAIQDGITEPLEDIIVTQVLPCSTGLGNSTTLWISDTIAMNIVSNDTSLCKEDSMHVVMNGSDSLHYTWTPSLGVSNDTLKEPWLSPDVTTTYTVCATLPGSGCVAKCDSIKITVNLPPNVFIGNDTIICKNMAIQFNPIVSPAQLYAYAWTGTGFNFLSSITTSNPIGTFTATGNYSIILNVEPTAVGCAGADTMNVKVLPNDIILFNGDTTVCKGAKVNINVTGDPLFTYNWTPSQYLNNPTLEDPISYPDTAISYTVTATYPGCLPMTKSFNIDVQPVPDIYAGADRVMCDFDTIRLQATVNPTWYTQYSYDWNPSNGLTDGTISNPVFNGHASQNIRLIVSTPIGCKDTDFLSITVYPTEFATITPEYKTVCPQTPFQFTASGAQSYLWVPSLGLNYDTIANPICTTSVSTDYTVYSTSTYGCVDTDIVRVDVASNAIIDAGEDVTIYPGEEVMLNATGNCSYFIWTPNYHLTQIDIKNPIASPPVSTKYYVGGTTEYGCQAMDSVTVKVSTESILDLPNAFSPGSGTSINDGLHIIVRGLATLKYFRIFNRWGELVFETTDITKGWDGRYNGKPQPLGTYVYVIDATTSTGQKFNKQGNVTLIR